MHEYIYIFDYLGHYKAYLKIAHNTLTETIGSW